MTGNNTDTGFADRTNYHGSADNPFSMERSLSTTKVHQLAKELGVDSKDIVEKCRAEEIPGVKDYRSSVSVGLAQTIREWFSAEAPKTAVEKAAHVDVEKVKKKSTRKARSESHDSDSGSGGDTATLTEEAPLEPEISADVTGETPASSARRRARGTKAEKVAAPVETAPAVAQPADESIESAAPVPMAEAESVAATPTETPIEQPVAPASQAVLAPAPVEVAAHPVRPAHKPEKHDSHGGHGHAAAPDAAHPPHAPASVAKHAGAVAAKPAAEVPVKPVRPVAPVTARGIPNVVQRPVVAPAGHRNVPAPAQLQGPKLVRVEAPDQVAAPRSRPRPPASPTMGGGPAIGRGGLPIPASGTGHRAKGRTEGTYTDDEEAKAKGKGARRGSGRTGDSGIDLIREWREADLLDRAERLASATGGMLRSRRRQLNKSQARASQAHAPSARPSVVEITPPLTVRQLSEAMGVKSGELLKKLMAQGAMVTVNQTVDAETAQMLAIDFGIELVVKAKESLYATLERQYREKADSAPKEPRSAIVTVLGHVDHGKTSLLDKIRSTQVAAGEAGGITQHIGAYTISITGSDGNAKRVTFLDTPGHQAFTAMRARGANLTDVVVLVVAADDGVMPQTVESINHAKAAGVPIVVALNKIDKPEANANKVLGQLAENGLNPTEWGGDTEVVRTSATTGLGVKELIEYLDYIAQLRELKASPGLPARGSVIESFMDPLRGVVARIMVQNGTLHVGDPMVCGPASGRVRQLIDDKGVSISEARPATPVEVIGLDNVPVGGDPLYVVEDLGHSKSIAEERARADRDAEIAQRGKVTLENLYDTIKRGQIKELNMILKADVQGSVDVLRKTMTEELSKEVQVKLLHSAVGGISESDVLLAEASNAIIVGFSVEPDESARKLAEDRGVDIRLYTIIYEITDDIRKALSGMLSPEKQEQILGHAEVRQVIRVSKVGNIGGCMVTDGVLQRVNKYRIFREESLLAEGLTLESLKRFKEDVKDVRGGLECGIKFAGHDDIKVGDRVEAYKTVDVARSL